MKAVSKINISYEDIETSQDILTGKILKKMIGFDFNKYLLNLEYDIESILKEHLDEIRKYDIDASEAFGRINQNLKKEVDILGKKVINDYKKKNVMIVESISKIYKSILPGGKLQEREVNIFEFLNRYGFRLINNLNNDFKIFDFLHKFIEIK
jgi:uncharacterized protein YllA (UPF0747 family)